MPVRDGVNVHLSFLLIAGMLVAGAHRAVAQSRPPDPLRLPTSGTVICRAIPVMRGHAVAVLLQVSEESDTLSGRESEFAFDSVGNPIFMVVSVSDSGEGERLNVHAIAVRFTPALEGYHRIFAEDSTGHAFIATDSASIPQTVQDGSGALPAHRTPLRDDEFIEARQLAHWAWNHRCGKSRHAPGDSTTLTKP